MSTTEFPASGPGAGINSQIEFIRSKPVVLRNSRFLCWVTLSGSFFAAVMSIGMVLMVFSLIFPTSELNGDRGWGAVGWGIAALALALCVPAYGPWAAPWQATRSISMAEAWRSAWARRRRRQNCFLHGIR